MNGNCQGDSGQNGQACTILDDEPGKCDNGVCIGVCMGIECNDCRKCVNGNCQGDSGQNGQACMMQDNEPGKCDNGVCAVAKSCDGYCGEVNPAGCYCDNDCFQMGDCCDGVCQACPMLTGCGLPDCLPGWNGPKEFGQGLHCYLIVNAKKTWAEAENHCDGLAGNLVSIHSSGENAYVSSTVAGTEDFWIGLHQTSNDGEIDENWFWSDGSVFSYASWDFGEPNDFDFLNPVDAENGEEDCAVGNWAQGEAPGHWNDIKCIATNAFVCKMPAQSWGQ